MIQNLVNFASILNTRQINLMLMYGNKFIVYIQQELQRNLKTNTSRVKL